MLHYVLSGRYDGTVINRADENFVLQMGSFGTLSLDVPATIDGFIPIQAFDPVHGEPASEIPGLSNTVGMVGLGLRGTGFGGTDQDSGASNFYINLGNNQFLDADFTIFAQVANMGTVNDIMALSQIDLTLDPGFGAGPGNIAFMDVPLMPNGDLVAISRAFVVQNSMNPPGEYNRDGRVDGADYVVWRRSSGAGIIGAGLAGDGNGNGVVDRHDYDVWRRRYGGVALGAGSASNVPEPAANAFVCTLMATLFLLRFRATTRSPLMD
jgi:cyclophilin family peptidyl-prolyl cis-trans isomerase